MIDLAASKQQPKTYAWLKFLVKSCVWAYQMHTFALPNPRRTLWQAWLRFCQFLCHGISRSPMVFASLLTFAAYHMLENTPHSQDLAQLTDATQRDAPSETSETPKKPKRNRARSYP